MNVKNVDRRYKADRLGYIVNRMRVRQDITPTHLAEELNVSERTIYRDLCSLEKGNALQKRYSRREGRYLLENELNLPPLVLTPSEATALFTAASNPALSRDNFFAPDLRAALNKVARALAPDNGAVLANGGTAPGANEIRESELRENTGANATDAQETNHSTHSGEVSPAITLDSIQRPTLEIIRRAIRSNHKLSLHHWSSPHSERAQVVAPYELRVQKEGEQEHWYLLANSETQGVRTFKISRVRGVEILADRFRFPRRFSADAYFDRAAQTAADGEEDMRVVVRFTPAVANLALEGRGHQFTGMVREADGALLCTACVSSLVEIAWWVLSYGDQAEVLSPPELREQFAQTARGMTLTYAHWDGSEAAPVA